MKKTRENGFYWVKDNGQWRVGEWLPNMERFKLTNGGHYSIGVLDEIDETPITRSQFKVEPGLSLQQCKDEVAMKNGFNSWIAMNEARYIKDHRDDYEIHLNEVLNEAVELHTASLTSEIKGLREENEKLKLTVEFYVEKATNLSEGRMYLMSVEPSRITVEGALEAFGFGSDGSKNN